MSKDDLQEHANVYKSVKRENFNNIKQKRDNEKREQREHYEKLPHKVAAKDANDKIEQINLAKNVLV